MAQEKEAETETSASASPFAISVPNGLFGEAGLETVDLLVCEVAPVSARDVELGEAAVVYAVKFLNIVTKVLKHSAHDAVAARMDDDAHLLAIARVNIAYLIGIDGAIFQLHALDERLKILFCDSLVKEDMINLADLITRVHKLLGHVSIIGKQEDARGVAVEAAYRVDALVARACHNVHHGATPLRIVGGGDGVFWLIEKHVYLLLRLELLTVVDNLGIGRDGDTHLGDDLPVYGYLASLDEFIGLAPATHATHGNEAVEAQKSRHLLHFWVGAIGIGLLLIVEYAGVYLITRADL